MSKTNFSEVSTAAISIEDQVDKAAPPVTVAVATASTHKVAITIKGVTYYILLSNV